MGGFLKLRSWYDDFGGEYATAILWGEVLKTPRVRYRPMPNVYVLLNWHTKKDKIVCQSWGDNDTTRVMAALSRKDRALFFGTYCKTHFVNSKGEQKEWYGVKVDMVIPMELIALVLQLFTNKNIQNLVFGDDPADPFESIDDSDYAPRKDDVPEIEIPDDEAIF